MSYQSVVHRPTEKHTILVLLHNAHIKTLCILEELRRNHNDTNSNSHQQDIYLRIANMLCRIDVIRILLFRHFNHTEPAAHNDAHHDYLLCPKCQLLNNSQANFCQLYECQQSLRDANRIPHDRLNEYRNTNRRLLLTVPSFQHQQHFSGITPRNPSHTPLLSSHLVQIPY